MTGISPGLSTKPDSPTRLQALGHHLRASTSSFSEQARSHLERSGLAPQAERVQRAAIPVFQALCATVLFFANSSLFVLGVVVAALIPEIMQSAIDRIVTIWNELHWTLKVILPPVTLFLALPITLALGSLFAGAKISLLLQGYNQGEGNLDTSCPHSGATDGYPPLVLD